MENTPFFVQCCMDQNIINHQSWNLLCNTVGGNLKTAVMFLLLKGIKFLHLWTIWKLNIHFVFYLSFFKASLPLLACSTKFVRMYWLCLLKAHNHLWERLAMFAYGKSETTSTAANIFTTYTQEGSGSDEKRCQRICVCTLIYTIMMAMMHCVYLLHDFRAFQMHFVKFLPCCVLGLFPQQALRLCGFAKKHLSCEQRSYIFVAHLYATN